MKHSKDLKKSKRKSAPECKCGKTKEIEWQGDGVQYPVFFCPDCGPAKNDWEKWWNEYRDAWKDKENWQQKKHQVSCIVGYFCHRYEKQYEQPFAFSYSSPIPYKDKEFVMARRLLTMFDGNAWEIGQYIKWGFEKLISPGYIITGLGFFTKPNIANRFKVLRAKRKVIRRRTPLPKNFIEWCKTNYPEIFELQELEVWNDLNGLVTHVKFYGLDGIEGSVVREAVRQKMLPEGPEYRKLED